MRVQSNNYSDPPETRFAWATTDNDLFSREDDLYSLALAVELHTHNGSNKGRAVETLAGGAIQTGSYAANSIPTAAYMDLSVTAGKIANGTITPDKLTYVPVNKAGDKMTGDLRLSRAGQTQVGAIFFGPDGTNNHIAFDGGQFLIYHDVPVGRMVVYADATFLRKSTVEKGYVYLGNQGQYIGFDGTNFVLTNGHRILTTQDITASLGVPLQGTIFIRQTSDIPADGRWQKVPDAAGRIMMGSGTTEGSPGISFSDNFKYGVVEWKLTTHLLPSNGDLRIRLGADGTGNTGQANAGANTSVNTANTGPAQASTPIHTHPFVASLEGNVGLTNKDERVFPPMYASPVIRRIA